MEEQRSLDGQRVDWPIFVWINDTRFLAGQVVSASRHRMWMTLNWLPPGLLQPGQEYRAEVRSDRRTRRRYLVLVRYIGPEGVGLEIRGELSTTGLPIQPSRLAS